MRKFNIMDKQTTKDIMYGGIVALMDNPTYFRKSTIDPKYSEWREPGLTALNEFMAYMTTQIAVVEEETLISKAKELTLKGLKGETV